MTTPQNPKASLLEADERAEHYYKLTRLDGRDIWGGRVDYGHVFRTGEVLKHPLYGKPSLYPENDATYFTVDTLPSETLGNFVYSSSMLRYPTDCTKSNWLGKFCPYSASARTSGEVSRPCGSFESTRRACVRD